MLAHRPETLPTAEQEHLFAEAARCFGLYGDVEQAAACYQQARALNGDTLAYALDELLLVPPIMQSPEPLVPETFGEACDMALKVAGDKTYREQLEAQIAERKHLLLKTERGAESLYAFLRAVHQQDKNALATYVY